MPKLTTGAQARAYLARQVASGRFVRGPRSRPIASLDDTYALRLARFTAARKGAVSQQAARRGQTATTRARDFLAVEQGKGRRTAPGGVGLEHPRSRWAGPRKVIPYRDAAKRDAHNRANGLNAGDKGYAPLTYDGGPDESRGTGFYAKQYRSPAAARRYADRLAADRIQVLTFGVLTSGYADGLGSVWRVSYTGPRESCPWGRIADGWVCYDNGLSGLYPDPRPAFDWIEKMDVRYGSNIG